MRLLRDGLELLGHDEHIVFATHTDSYLLLPFAQRDPWGLTAAVLPDSGHHVDGVHGDSSCSAGSWARKT